MILSAKWPTNSWTDLHMRTENLQVGQVQSPNIFTCRSLRSGQLDSDMHVCESLLSGFSLKAFLHATRVEANRFACAYVKVNVNLCILRPIVESMKVRYSVTLDLSMSVLIIRANSHFFRNPIICGWEKSTKPGKFHLNTSKKVIETTVIYLIIPTGGFFLQLWLDQF